MDDFFSPAMTNDLQPPCFARRIWSPCLPPEAGCLGPCCGWNKVNCRQCCAPRPAAQKSAACTSFKPPVRTNEKSSFSILIIYLWGPSTCQQVGKICASGHFSLARACFLAFTSANERPTEPHHLHRSCCRDHCPGHDFLRANREELFQWNSQRHSSQRLHNHTQRGDQFGVRHSSRQHHRAERHGYYSSRRHAQSEFCISYILRYYHRRSDPGRQCQRL